MAVPYENLCDGLSLIIAVIGAVTDVRSRRIPNWLTGPALLFGLVLHIVFGGWSAMLAAALAAVIAGGIFLVFYLAGGMGAGDVKLMAAVAALTGIHRLVSVLVTTALVGGLLGLIFAIYRRQFKSTLRNVGSLIAFHGASGLQPHPELNLGNTQTLRLPYGIAIAAGAAISLCNAAFGVAQ